MVLSDAKAKEVKYTIKVAVISWGKKMPGICPAVSQMYSRSRCVCSSAKLIDSPIGERRTRRAAGLGSSRTSGPLRWPPFLLRGRWRSLIARRRRRLTTCRNVCDHMDGKMVLSTPVAYAFEALLGCCDILSFGASG